MDEADDEGASRCVDGLAAHAQSQAGGIAQHGSEKADLGLQGAEKLSEADGDRLREATSQKTDHCQTMLHLSPSDVCTRGTWEGDGLHVAFLPFLHPYPNC